MLTREEEREPCREKGGGKRRESEGEGGRGERATEIGIAFVPLPSPKPSPRTLLRRTSTTCRAVSGMIHKQ